MRGSPASPALTSTWTGSASIPCRAAEVIVASIPSARLYSLLDDSDVALSGGEIAVGAVGVGIGEEAIEPLKFIFQMRPDKCFPESGGACHEIPFGRESLFRGRPVHEFVGFLKLAVEGAQLVGVVRCGKLREVVGRREGASEDPSDGRGKAQ